MSKLELAIDIDGVLFDFAGSLARYIHRQTGKPLEEMTAPQTWEFWDQWGITKAEWVVHFTRYGETGGFYTGAPITEGVHVLQALKKRGHSIHILTARGCHWGSSERFRTKTKADTVSFLSFFNIPYDSLLFSARKEIINADIFLDDCPSHLEDIRSTGKRAVAFDQLYNREFTGERVANWFEFYDLVEERGKGAGK